MIQVNESIINRIKKINSGIVPDGYKKTKVGIVPVEWEVCHFKKKFSRLKRKNTENNTNVLTISAQYGLINQEEFFNKSVASEDKSNYYLLYKGDFAYNKSYSNGYPFGAIKSLERYEKGVVSPLYICFSATDENKCPEFYLQYFENGMMNREIQAFAQEGARNHGLLNISVDDFFNSYIVSPPLPEQQKIAEILSTQDKLIELHEKKVEKLKELKKAYLQKMFPQKGSKYPEIRFKGFTDAWEGRKLGDVIEDLYNGQTPSRANSEYWNGDINWLSSGDLNRGIISKTTEKITEKGLQNARLRIIKSGTFVMSITGLEAAGTRGNCGILNIDTALNQSCMALFPQKDILDTKFLFQWYRKVGEEYGINYTQGTKQQSYNAELIKILPIEFPKLEEQKKIANYFQNLDTLITLHQRKLDKEKEKKKALMQLLLTGKVRCI